MTILDTLPTVELGADERYALLAVAAGRGTDNLPTAEAQAATVTILAAYAPALRYAIARAAKGVDRDDAEATCVEALLGVIATHLGSQWRDLTAHVQAAMRGALAELANSTLIAFSGIDPRERRRFLDHVYRACDANLSAAYDRVGEVHTMSRGRFVELAAALFGVTSLDAPNAYASEDTPDAGAEAIPADAPALDDAVADRDLVAWLLAKLPIRERAIVMLYYGFGTDDSVSGRLADAYYYGPATVNLSRLREAAGLRHDEDLDDEAVGVCVGLSRSGAIRARHRALTTMRAALALSADGTESL